jgi:hypothetical protein
VSSALARIAAIFSGRARPRSQPRVDQSKCRGRQTFVCFSTPVYCARLEPVGDLHRPSGLGEALGEGIADAVLHQNPVGADAGLAGIPGISRRSPP